MSAVVLFLGEDAVAQSIANAVRSFCDLIELKVISCLVKDNHGRAELDAAVNEYLLAERGGENLACTFVSCEDVNSNALLQKLVESDLLCAINIRGKQRFKLDTIEFFQKNKVMFVNLHPGLLPEYRGLFSVFWAMNSNEKIHGCTLHVIDDRLDTGSVIDRKSIDLDYNESVLENLKRLIPVAVKMLENYLVGVKMKCPVGFKEQTNFNAAYYSYPSPEMVKQFSRKGLFLIKPGESA